MKRLVLGLLPLMLDAWVFLFIIIIVFIYSFVIKPKKKKKKKRWFFKVIYSSCNSCLNYF